MHNLADIYAVAFVKGRNDKYDELMTINTLNADAYTRNHMAPMVVWDSKVHKHTITKAICKPANCYFNGDKLQLYTTGYITGNITDLPSEIAQFSSMLRMLYPNIREITTEVGKYFTLYCSDYIDYLELPTYVSSPRRIDINAGTVVVTSPFVYLDRAAFENCNITNLIFKGLVCCEAAAFKASSFENIIFEKGLMNLPMNCFTECKVTNPIDISRHPMSYISAIPPRIKFIYPKCCNHLGVPISDIRNSAYGNLDLYVPYDEYTIWSSDNKRRSMWITADNAVDYTDMVYNMIKNR